ncbi:hypothetical protein [Sandaracinobacteroides saxicola]|uniref:Uncharacterized protein n=1 Tax=Sandaracinobacteroides saxicola TaxID=2759707 RepID=A0A7G5IHR3_9SPHN|nr:hypothetical protein [Sandaracinobacteroides saxicola]QMW22905.1 hypothetical protein H3309_16685 [Sandaracinobacteroides saxicola]
MQRIRAGLTGLGLVFLVVLVASILISPSKTVVPAKAPGEPLAVLGVAPSQPDTPVEVSPPPKQPVRMEQPQPTPPPALTEI